MGSRGRTRTSFEAGAVTHVIRTPLRQRAVTNCFPLHTLWDEVAPTKFWPVVREAVRPTDARELTSELCLTAARCLELLVCPARSGYHLPLAPSMNGYIPDDSTGWYVGTCPTAYGYYSSTYSYYYTSPFPPPQSACILHAAHASMLSLPRYLPISYL